MAYGGRFIDWLRGLTQKSSTIDGTEQIHLDSSGLSMRGLLSDIIRYGGGTTRNTTAGNATVTRTTTGGLYLELTGQTAGNARGTGAFDWQAARSSADSVASGNYSAAFGENNSAIGANSFAIGRACVANGQYGFAAGLYAYAFGFGSAAIGLNLRADNQGQLAFGRGPTALASQAQGNLQTFYTATTDATLTPLNITGTATDRMVIPATRTVAFRGTVVAMCNVSSSSNFIKAWVITGVITRDGSNNTRIVGTPSIEVIAQDTDGTQTPSTWAITSITADDTNESLAINVTGQTGQTIRWQATLIYSQVGF